MSESFKSKAIVALGAVTLSAPPAALLGSFVEQNRHHDEVENNIRAEVLSALPGVLAPQLSLAFQEKVDDAESVRRTRIYAEVQTSLNQFGLELNALQGELELRMEMENDALNAWRTLQMDWKDGKITSIPLDLSQVQTTIDKILEDPLSNPNAFKEKQDGLKESGAELKKKVNGLGDDWDMLKKENRLLSWDEAELESILQEAIEKSSLTKEKND